MARPEGLISAGNLNLYFVHRLNPGDGLHRWLTPARGPRGFLAKLAQRKANAGADKAAE
ncbi:MAG: hypothetical protein H0U99_07425 [Chthoniobacterales bacterium]|nr:hypothetical protein [Chthoniobacterales bacterium]